MKKLLLITIIVGFCLQFGVMQVNSQGLDTENLGQDIEQTLQENINLFDPENSIFGNLDSFSIYSVLATLGSAYTVGAFLVWVVVILKIVVDAFRAENKEQFEEAQGQGVTLLLSIAYTFAFPAIISIAGYAAGIGNIFQMPAGLRYCYGDDGGDPDYYFYFQAILSLPSGNVDDYCFGSGSLPNLRDTPEKSTTDFSNGSSNNSGGNVNQGNVVEGSSCTVTGDVVCDAGGLRLDCVNRNGDLIWEYSGEVC